MFKYRTHKTFAVNKIQTILTNNDLFIFLRFFLYFQKKPKNTPKRLNAFERAQREGEEFLKALGVSLEDSGRRSTRSSTRGQSSAATTPSTTESKRKQYSTPRRSSKKAKLEIVDQTDSGNHVEQNDKVDAQV